MFNELNNQPVAAKSAVDDIFAETDNGAPHVSQGDVNIEAQPAGLAAHQYAEEGDSDGGKHGPKIKTVLIIILGAVIMGAAAYLIYSKFIQPSEDEVLDVNSGVVVPPVNTPTNSNVVDNNVVTPVIEDNVISPVIEEPQINDPIAPVDENPIVVAPVDSDGDSLTDVQEATLGTDPNLIDSDFDGLSDYEEIYVYGTDPLNPDSDGDGFSDGDEVRNGYNPKGEGRLQ